jgi:hypothetical protein
MGIFIHFGCLVAIQIEKIYPIGALVTSHFYMTVLMRLLLKYEKSRTIY